MNIKNRKRDGKWIWHRRLGAGLLALALAMGLSVQAAAESGVPPSGSGTEGPSGVKQRSETAELFSLTGSGSRLAVVYDVEPGGTVQFDRGDFQDFYEEKSGGDTLQYVEFSSVSGESAGTLYAEYGEDGERRISWGSLDGYQFYSRSESYGDFPLRGLAFVAKSSAGGDDTVLSFTAYGSGGDYDGEVTVRVEDEDDSDYGEIVYTVRPGNSVSFNRSDFNDAYRERYSGSLRYVVFTVSSISGGVFSSGNQQFTASTLGSSRFYYSSSTNGDYALDSLTFQADDDFSGVRTLRFRATGSSGSVSGTVRLEVSSSTRTSSSTGSTIYYSLYAGESVAFRREDFVEMAERKLDSTPRYVTFSTTASITTSLGTLYRNYGRSGEKSFSRTTLSDYRFYFFSSDFGDYDISELSFAAPSSASARTVRLRYTLYDVRDEAVSGNVEITQSAQRRTISITTDNGSTVTVNTGTGTNAGTGTNTGTSISVNTGTSANPGTSTAGGTNAGTSTAGGTNIGTSTAGSVPAGGTGTSGTGANAGSTSGTGANAGSTSGTGTAGVSGTEQDAAAPLENIPSYAADIRYTAANNAPIHFSAEDFQRFFRQRFTNGTLERVRLHSVPASGRLYYNYYGTSNFGSTVPKLLDASAVSRQDFYTASAALDRYALTELYFSPVSGVNVCVTIPFTAYGTIDGESVQGAVLISATNRTVAEVYGVTSAGAAVGFPAEPILSAVAAATGVTPAGIRLLALPSPSAGTLYEGEGAAVTVGKIYPASAGSVSAAEAADNAVLSALRFVPAAGYTGSAQVPYLAVDSSGAAFAAGSFAVGIVNNLRRFSDVGPSAWCFKYVTELADAGILGGYPDGTFQPDNAVTWGAALKLILLSAGYPEQQETAAATSDVFARYLDLARQQGIVTGTVNLSAPITRLAVARTAAAALRLDLTNLPVRQPFTDTTDPSVQALNAAGILNGYEENGTAVFRPGSTLTRGQLAAILWRMRYYQ